jgi:ribosomal protein L21E
LLEKWKDKGAGITIESLDDARVHGLVGEVIVNDDNSLSIEVNFTKMQKLLPNIQFMNRVLKSNQDKSSMA